MEDREIKTKSVSFNMILNMIKTVLGVLYPFITFPYVSRVLGPVGTGKVAFGNSIVQYFVLVAGLGIGTYAAREGAKVRNDSKAFNKLSKEMFIINFLSTLIAYISFFICIFIFPNLKDYRLLLIVQSSTMLFGLFSFGFVTNAVEDFLYITVRSIFFMILGLVLLFVFVKTPDDYIWYAALSVISSVGASILNMFHVRKYINIFEKTQIEIKKHLKPIFIIFSTTLATNLAGIIDNTMLGVLLGDEGVGIYNASVKLNLFAVAFICSFSDVLTPRMSNYYENDKPQFEVLLNRALNLILMLSIPCMVGLYYLAAPFTTFFCGDKFISAIPSMKVLTCLVLFLPVGSIMTFSIFIPTRHDKYNLIPIIISSVINVVLNYILIKHYQVIGAAIATLIAEFICMTIKVVLGCKVQKNLLTFFKYIWQYILAAALMIGVLLLFNKFVPVSNLGWMFVDILIGAAVYGIVLIVLRNKYLLGGIDRILIKLKIKKV